MSERYERPFPWVRCDNCGHGENESEDVVLCHHTSATIGNATDKRFSAWWCEHWKSRKALQAEMRLREELVSCRIPGRSLVMPTPEAPETTADPEDPSGTQRR